MAKEEGAKTVVVGGKSDVGQQFCGTVGGQSSDFSTMDTEVKVRFQAQMFSVAHGRLSRPSASKVTRWLLRICEFSVFIRATTCHSSHLSLVHVILHMTDNTCEFFPA